MVPVAPRKLVQTSSSISFIATSLTVQAKNMDGDKPTPKRSGASPNRVASLFRESQSWPTREATVGVQGTNAAGKGAAEVARLKSTDIKHWGGRTLKH